MVWAGNEPIVYTVLFPYLQLGEGKKKPRRTRVPFSRQEEDDLIAGVRKLDKQWRHILAAYHFHPARTSVDLKDKYRLLEAKEMV